MGISSYSFIIFFDKHILYIKNKDRKRHNYNISLKLWNCTEAEEDGGLVSMKDYTINTVNFLHDLEKNKRTKWEWRTLTSTVMSITHCGTVSLRSMDSVSPPESRQSSLNIIHHVVSDKISTDPNITVIKC